MVLMIWKGCFWSTEVSSQSCWACKQGVMRNQVVAWLHRVRAFSGHEERACSCSSAGLSGGQGLWLCKLNAHMPKLIEGSCMLLLQQSGFICCSGPAGAQADHQPFELWARLDLS